MFTPETKLDLSTVLSRVTAENQIRQLQSTGSQPRPGLLSPNTIPNAVVAGIPQHVSDVRCVTTKISDISSKVVVTFSRNPADYAFVECRCYVTGYAGNQYPVQVGSGNSPISFTLQNSGESVIVTVQASGSTGDAPISTAPTTTLQLVKTPLATTPTEAGNGTATGGSSLVLMQTTVLTPTDVTGLTGSFVAITPTPPSGQWIAPVVLRVQYKFNTTDYGATGTFTFIWGSTPSANFAYRVLNGNGFLNPGDGLNRYAVCAPVSEADSGVALTPSVVDGLPIVVANAAAAFNSGDGDVIITAYYTVETVA